MRLDRRHLYLAATAMAAFATQALAQQAAPDSSVATGAGQVQLNDVVITASTGNPLSKLRSSASVSTIKADALEQSAPSSAADIVRDIPGFRSEASGGEGNANVSVRGLPLASGGAKYVQFQEDGLPVLQFGDIDFATGDQFLRADFNIDRVEAVRGGASSTTVSDAPGGVINFISKTGSREGGAFGVTTGLDYQETRLDFDYGGPIASGWRFHAGGFYHFGEGPRDTGFQTVDGGQFKANLTHDLDDGFIRFDVKVLDDKSPVYLPIPIMLGHDSASNFPGINAASGVLQTPQLQSDTAVNANGQRVTTHVADGYHSKTQAFGVEFSKGFGGGWRIDDKFRVSRNSGDFVGPFTQQVGTAANMATALGAPGGAFSYATGGLAGQGYNGYVAEVALFNVTLNDLGNVVNDVKINKTFAGVQGGDLTVQFGLFSSRQSIVEDWHWNTYLEQVSGKNASLVNLTNAASHLLTAGGLLAYGEPLWGNCCVRSYDLTYTTNAPYASLNWQGDKLNIDASLRYDIAKASGTYGGATGTTVMNVGNTPALTAPDMSVPIVNTYWPVNYTKRYLSYSLGANYAFSPDLAVFARTSEGGRFNAERLLFGGGVIQSGPGIGTTSNNDAVNEVWQTEGGVKYRTGALSIYVTAFYAVTRETNADFTNPVEPYINDTYHSQGVEFEGSYRIGDFGFHGGVTYTDSKIHSAADNPASVGKTPQRQAPWVFQGTAQYTHGPVNLGVNLIGTSDSYASNANTQKMPGYTEVNAFAEYKATDRLTVFIRGNNIFNTIGITEIDGANVARSINGETVSAGLKYSF